MTKNKLTYVKRLSGGLIVMMLLACLAGAAPAMAERGAWWNLSASTWPAALPSSGEGTLNVVAENVGDKNAQVGTLTLTDKIPAGTSVQSVQFFSNPTGNSGLDLAPILCETTGRTIMCTFPAEELPLAPYEVLELLIRVKVEGAQSGALNEVTMFGGGAAAPQTYTRPLRIGDTPAGFGVENYELKSEEEGGRADTQAGSHPFQLTTNLLLNQTSDPSRLPGKVKDLNFKLPPGLIGNPTPFARCTIAQFSASVAVAAGFSVNRCAQKTVLGVADITIYENLSFGGVITHAVPLYNLTPAVGEPARFGFLIFGNPVLLDTSVRTGGDYGVTVSVRNTTELPNFMASRVTFWGVPGDPAHDIARGPNCIHGGTENEGVPCSPLREDNPPPLLTMPTSCTGSMPTSLEADFWQDEGNFETVPAEPLPGMGGCNRLPSSPTISVAPDGQAGSTPTGLTVDVHVPQEQSLNAKGLAEADVKDTTVALPQGVVLNPAAADGLQSCSLSQIALESPEAPGCPAASKVGTVEINTPLLPNQLTGAAYLATQNVNPFGSLVALYVFVEDPISGSRVKLAGEVVPDPVTGQLSSTFKNTPQLPFEDFKLHFFGGDRAPLGTPASCGAYTTTATIAPWSGNAPAQSYSTFDITAGPNGTPCASPLPFAPSLAAGTTSNQAGGFSPFAMTMSREDGSQDLQSIRLHMPAGLLGTLSSVKLCGEPQADAGTCGAESLIGETTVSVGLGGDPYSVTGGRVYITGPYDGAPYGLSIVNPAVAGPFNLGNVIVRAKIEVDRTTAALTITTDQSGPYAIPHILDGIPLQIKHINVSINRAGFTFNPTDCNKLAITGSLGSAEGAASTLSVPFQVTNCAALAFKPKLTASTSGKTSRRNGASLHVKLTYPEGPYDSNIARVKVDLPKQLPSRLTTLQKACTAAQFNANPAGCPAASLIGHATAITPVIPVPLEGPAYFVSHGGEAFPSLIVVLQGYGTTVDLVGSTFISAKGITSSTFKQVPDVPVGSFELTLPEGKFSALAANGNLCKSKLAMPTAFVGQNGAEVHTSTPISTTGCPKAKKSRKASKNKR